MNYMNFRRNTENIWVIALQQKAPVHIMTIDGPVFLISDWSLVSFIDRDCYDEERQFKLKMAFSFALTAPIVVSSTQLTDLR